MLKRLFSLSTIGRRHPSEYGPMLMGAGVAVVLVAQLLPSVPIAASFALIGWGGRLARMHRRRRSGFVPSDVAIVAVYALLTFLAAAAQLDLALRGGSFVWRLAATTDAWLALIMGTALVGQALSQLLQSRCEER